MYLTFTYAYDNTYVYNTYLHTYFYIYIYIIYITEYIHIYIYIYNGIYTYIYIYIYIYICTHSFWSPHWLRREFCRNYKSHPWLRSRFLNKRARIPLTPQPPLPAQPFFFCCVKLDKTIIQQPPGYRRRRGYIAAYGWVDGEW